MSIESELFANVEIQRDKLADYGFQPEGDLLIYRKPIPEDRFEIVLTWDGTIRGRIKDLDTGDEYVNFRMENAAGYSAGIRKKFTDLLTDVRDRCGRKLWFKTAQARRICAFLYETYGDTPEFLWPSIPSYAAFRLKGTKKWYAVMGAVPRNKVDPASGDAASVEVVNVKADGGKISGILAKGYYPAFHMNKKCWVSIILDDTLSDGEIHERIADSRERVKEGK